MQPSEEDVAWFKSTFHPIPKPTLPEDCIEYSAYLISADHEADNDSELRLRLGEVQKYAGELQKQWLRGYIWQRQGFTLELSKEDGASFLKGRTEFGDSIEDEWVIVWLLREITKKFGNVWIKVTDGDGEFLLIEASGTIPEWLEPEVAENRVWIHDGQLKILKPKSSARSSKRTSETLSLHEAQQVMLKEPKRIMHSTSIEEDAFYRLRNYPAQINDNMHYAMISLPRKVAFLLLQRPAYISPAIEAFYLRDPIGLKPLQKSDGESELNFAPKDLVTLSVKFPRVGYAQIKSQEFPAPRSWIKSMPPTSNPVAYTRVNSGMKLSCGFEMLLSDPQYQDKPLVREIKIVLEDLESGDEKMPTDADIDKLEKREDPEKWLDIDFNDLERELDGKSRAETTSKKPEFGDKAAQENLQRIVKQFEEFLNDDKGEPRENGLFNENSDSDVEDDREDGADDSDEDKDASFDEDEFTKMMQEMMGMPADVMREIMSGTIDALAEGQSEKAPQNVQQRARAKIEEVDSSDEDVEDFKQMESELRASGALNLNPRSTKSKTRLAQHAHSQHVVEDEDANSDSDSEDDNGQGSSDFDAEFARNLLQSFKLSGGMGGPAANLMSMMGESASGESSGSKKPSSKK